MNNERFLDIAVEAAITASNIVMDDFLKIRKPKYKGSIDLVTKTDLESEKIIKNIILSSYPNHSILAEESGKKKTRSDFLWIIDPIDGTTNFVHGCSPFSISIALFYKKEPIVSTILELPNLKLYTAIKDKGAWCEGNSIKCSKTKILKKSLLVTGFSYNYDYLWEQNMLLFKKLTRASQGVRRFGSASLDICYVAEGVLDGFWEYNLNPWDTAAGILIAAEAGCLVSNIKGESFNIYNNSILVTNKNINKEIIKVISSVKIDS